MCRNEEEPMVVVRATTEPPRSLLHRTEPYDANLLRALKVDPSSCTSVSFDAGSELYKLVCSHVAKESTVSSYALEIVTENRPGGRARRVASASLGLGLFPFVCSGTQFYALHQTVGEPAGTDCGVSMLSSLVLLTPGKGNTTAIKELCDKLLAEADKTDASSFTVYRWQVRHGYWARDASVPARPLESVVLPAATKAKVVDDVLDFVADETAGWYHDHGIPYKRAYLLWGAPGSGKTSLVQALAGKLQRNVCYLSPTHPEMTDDNLKNAVQRCPANSILVLEDVDALFGSKREKKIQQSPLTFSGLLNAIDGVGSSTGQIFVLTTNHREQLDPALIRNGRVDLHVGFGGATAEQMVQLFRQFYPRADEALATRFEAKLSDALAGTEVSMAALQHYFILKRKSSAEDAAEGVSAILEEMAERLQKEQTQAKANESDASPETDAAPQKANKPADGTADDATGSNVHVHVHLPTKSAGK